MRKKISKRQFFAVATVVSVIFGASFLIKSRSAAKQSPLATQPVKTTLAKEADKNIPVEISGFVRGENRADIAPMTSGKILRIFKHEGETVKKGELLATIDANQQSAQVASARASVEALKKTLDDSKKYYDQLVDQAREAPDSDATDESIKSAKRGRDLQIQAAKNQLIAAQGALDIARTNMDNSLLTAPFPGTITAVHTKEGGFANFSMPLISLSTKDSLEIETYLSASQGRNISIGSAVALQSPDGVPVSGTVTSVSSGSDSYSLKTLIRIHINDELDALRLGDFLHGQIMIPRQQAAVSIPRNAVVSRGGDQVVFIVDENNIAKEQTVRISSEHDGFVDISDGVIANQKVVTEGQQYLISGSATTSYATN